MKKVYNNPEIEIVLFSKDNVIVCSDPLDKFGANAYFPLEWGDMENYFNNGL